MKYILVLLFIAITSFQKDNKSECDYIANYYQKIYKADIEYQTENYEKAFELYQDAFNSCEPIDIPGINEFNNFAELCAILDKNDLSLEFIKKYISRGYGIKGMLQNSNFDNVFASQKGKELLTNYEQLKNDALSKLNLSLRNEIKEMKREDQKYRNENYQENKNKQKVIDEYNTSRIIEIFNEFGYPNESIIGGYPIDKSQVHISVMLLHTSDSIRMNYFVPKLTEFVKNGTCPPEVLGSIIDQYYLYNGEPQINGTYTKQGGGYSNMISDLKKVDSNRISIGLPPLELKEKKDSILRQRYGNRF